MTKHLCLGLLLVSSVSANDLPDGPGKATVEKVCGNCHGAETAISRKLSKEGWEKVIREMVERGASGTDAEFDQVVAYLAKNFPEVKVNVNTATADEFAQALDIANSTAAAIVKYRTDRGNFKSVEDLKKVPGLDAKKVDDKKSSLVF